MWSLISQAIFKPDLPQVNTTLPLLYHPETTSSSTSTTTKVASPAQPYTPFCCDHQIPSSHPISHILTLFLRALTLRRQQLIHTNTNTTSPTTTLFQTKMSSPTVSFNNNQTVIEFEISANMKYSQRTFQQKYYVPTQGLQRTDVELYPEGAFHEVSLMEVEGMRATRGGKQDWGFLKRDDVAKERVTWSCEGCGWGYWVRVVTNSE